MLKTYFTDDTTYSAEDFNTAVSCLFTSGITAVSDGANVIDSFNAALSQAVSEGVDVYTNNSCKVYLSGGNYKINPGVCICPGGAILLIDDTYEINPQSGDYVYAEHNILRNTVEIVVSQTAGDSQTVPLAFINSDGSVEDRRIFATAKVGLTSANQYKNATVDVKYYLTYDEALANPTVIDVGFTGFGYVYTEHTSVYSSDNRMLLYDVSDCTEKQIDVNGTFNTQLYIKKQGSKLLVYGVIRKNTTTMQKNFLIM